MKKPDDVSLLGNLILAQTRSQGGTKEGNNAHLVLEPAQKFALETSSLLSSSKKHIKKWLSSIMLFIFFIVSLRNRIGGILFHIYFDVYNPPNVGILE